MAQQFLVFVMIITSIRFHSIKKIAEIVVSMRSQVRVPIFDIASN